MPDEMPRDDLTHFEQWLAALRPASGGLDRDRMLFEAGRASARAEGRARAWALTAAASVLVAVGLALGLARERSRRLDLERSLVAASRISPAIEPPSPPSPPIDVAPDSYLALSRRLVAGLDDPRPAPEVPVGRPAPDRLRLPLRVREPDGLRDL